MKSARPRKRAAVRAQALAALACIAGSSAGCGAALPSVDPPQSAAELCRARAHIAALKREHGDARKQTVKLTLSAPVMPQPLSARGAVAFAPAHDLRMILLGPGGGTALDLWMRDRTYRFEVPALGRVVRGDEHTPPEKKRGLPVDFLRWWLLDPFGGDVVYAREGARGLEMVLRDLGPSGSTSYVDGTLFANGRFEATRTTWNADGERLDLEKLSASSVGCGTVEYEQSSTRLVVVAVCESESGAVNPKAFADPDAPEAKR